MPVETIDFGIIQVVIGNEHGKYPFCNTLFIDDEIKTVIDPGASYKFLSQLAHQNTIHRVLLSHYHEDHTRCTPVFDTARVQIHTLDLEGARTVEGLMDCYGAEGEPDGNIWLNYLVRGLHLKDLPQVEPLPGDTLSFGKTRALVLHTPGHTPGHCCFLFPDQGMLYCADIDLDPFGPYYGDQVSSLSAMLASIEKVMEIDPEVLVTGHVAGVVRKDIQSRLKAYRDVIFLREEKIARALQSPQSVEGLCRLHLIYGKQFEPRTIFNLIERNMIAEHLVRLVQDKRVERVGEDLFIAG